jgi:hypothetical protein
MGTKGRTGSKTATYGTNTIRVMEELTECPVFAVPENARFSQLKEIVFPTDYKISFKQKELNYLIEIAGIHNCFVRVLYIDNSDAFDRNQMNNKELLETIFEHTDHSYHTLKEVKVQEGINAFIESRNSDIIAFINRKHHFFGSIFKKPLVKELGYHARIPILELNDRS